MTLLYPMFAMVLYMFAIGVSTFIIRFRAFKSGSVKLGYYRHLDTAKYDPPEFLVRVGRHYDNQFQLPLLFLATCLVCLQLRFEGFFFVLAAWLFILTRVVHTVIHLGSNHILKRAMAFQAGWWVILAMWILILNAL